MQLVRRLAEIFNISLDMFFLTAIEFDSLGKSEAGRLPAMINGLLLSTLALVGSDNDRA